ncbi:MAG: pilin [Xanthomonadales bacterium]|nr:pilin [Xanthomonadales bacterium]
MNKQRGFTLIELMIVIAIIAILMAYAVPAYRDYTVRAKAGEALMLSAPLKRYISEVWVNTGVVNNLNSGIDGVPAANDMTGEYVSQISVASGIITASYQNDASLIGNTLTLTPYIPGQGGNNGTSLLWVCSSTLENKFLPVDCRTN